jgi:repressor LexA
MPHYDERAAEYVDSPLMSHRLRYERQLSVSIEGRYGNYRTRVSVEGGGGSCTCSSDERPCKHIRALRRTWRANRGSFFDLNAFLTRLSQSPKAFLVAALANMILAQPACLGVLGVKGFDSEEDFEEREGALPPEAPRSALGAPRLTALQGQYLAFIYFYEKIHGRAPAEADLQRHFRVSPPTVHQMILTLDSRGVIAREPGKPRTIRVLVSRDELPELA